MTASRLCSKLGCLTVVFGGKAGYCKEHQRPSPSKRGYGKEHQQRRRTIATSIAAGQIVRCWRCDTILTSDFHLDHSDDRSAYRGPACVSCNTSLAGKKSRLLGV